MRKRYQDLNEIEVLELNEIRVFEPKENRDE